MTDDLYRLPKVPDGSVLSGEIEIFSDDKSEEVFSLSDVEINNGIATVVVKGNVRSIAPHDDSFDNGIVLSFRVEGTE